MKIYVLLIAKDYFMIFFSLYLRLFHIIAKTALILTDFDVTLTNIDSCYREYFKF